MAGPGERACHRGRPSAGADDRRRSSVRSSSGSATRSRPSRPQAVDDHAPPSRSSHPAMQRSGHGCTLVACAAPCMQAASCPAADRSMMVHAAASATTRPAGRCGPVRCVRAGTEDARFGTSARGWNGTRLCGDGRPPARGAARARAERARSRGAAGRLAEPHLPGRDGSRPPVGQHALRDRERARALARRAALPRPPVRSRPLGRYGGPSRVAPDRPIRSGSGCRTCRSSVDRRVRRSGSRRASCGSG